ncbi:hypothetical protein EV1_037701 [Malus domestica]
MSPACVGDAEATKGVFSSYPNSSLLLNAQMRHCQLAHVAPHQRLEASSRMMTFPKNQHPLREIERTKAAVVLKEHVNCMGEADTLHLPLSKLLNLGRKKKIAIAAIESSAAALPEAITL